ncbi:hypothetical protein TWF217_003477 [Orbilia oligospora]|nr:hypothetical protein TWF751_004044 [Orbilia oligospora]KAF3263770.1 hypothetical protein TWF217_003477 [Orbilia oligospora]KAF3297989.1 hypothetical protein TWF132_004134 [Orbilia oligospora]
MDILAVLRWKSERHEISDPKTNSQSVPWPPSGVRLHSEVTKALRVDWLTQLKNIKIFEISGRPRQCGSAMFFLRPEHLLNTWGEKIQPFMPSTILHTASCW